jgi:nitrite reductase/ring-hydroxylating ferredoxin subunit
VANNGDVSTAATGLRRIDLCGLEDVSPGTMKLVDLEDEGELVLVVNLNGRLHATQGVCSHQYFELNQGFLTGESLTCALHLSRFDLDTGEALDPPAELPLAVYQVVVEGGRILIEVPEGPLAVNR